jgi:hypothetical protein
MPTTAVTLVVVCLPDTGSTRIPDILADDAVDRFRAATGTGRPPGSSSGVTLPGHFAYRCVRRSRLVQPWQGHTAGGPVRLLDLQAMRAHQHHLYWQRWLLWRHVVTGTPVAQPYWMFSQRHLQQPRRFPLAAAQRAYLAQPRVTAMRVHNAVAAAGQQLPTADLEALQTGGEHYAEIGWLEAVPGDAFLDVTGRYHTARGDVLADRLTYLATVNDRIDRLDRDAGLVALAVG